MSWTVEIDEEAADEIADLRAFDRARIVDAIKHLATNADHGKVITAVVEGWGEPVWQLRVGDFRVFYSIDGDLVTVHAVREKGNKTTGEVL